jgi:hypothetical protein
MKPRAAALMLILALAGCARPLCDVSKEIGENRRIRVTLVAAYVEGGSHKFDARYLRGKPNWPSCGNLDGLIPGAQVQLKTIRAESYRESCESLVAAVESAPPELEFQGDFTGGRGFVASSTTVEVGSCSGFWSLRFEATTATDPFAKPVEGELPPVIAMREFQSFSADASNATCVSCSDAFVVELEKVP